jgi:FkbM family methyltransferase
MKITKLVQKNTLIKTTKILILDIKKKAPADKMRKSISNNIILRRIVLNILQHLDFNVSLKHPYTKIPIMLHVYKHKGYWFHRKSRERTTMNKFSELISVGQTVLEFGGHIGFITALLSQLVGKDGKVVVFEPSPTNVPYLQQNILNLENVIFEKLAVGDKIGDAQIWEDDITGQNSSLLMNYRGFSGTQMSHFGSGIITGRSIEMTTIDHYIRTKDIHPSGFKMDIEGYEYFALLGATETLKIVDWIVIEVSENQSEVFEILKSNGFFIYLESGEMISKLPYNFFGNLICTRR